MEGRVEFVGSEGAIVSLTTELSANKSDILSVCLKRSLKLHIYDLKAVVWDLKRKHLTVFLSFSFAPKHEEKCWITEIFIHIQ